MGHLVLNVAQAPTGTANIPISDLLNCKFCFEEQVGAVDGRLSKVYSTSASTGSGNHLNHATFKHGKSFQQPLEPKITNWLQNGKEGQSAKTQFEFNRDLTLMICRDLQPFSMVERSGFKEFCRKNTSFEMPSADCVSGTALVNVYDYVKRTVVDVLSSCASGTLMMDGWTDKYRCLPYFGIRISVVHDWKFEVITLAVQPVESHTAEQLSRFVISVIKEFLPQDRKLLLFNTTDRGSQHEIAI
jgi:hypothetical protein